MDLLMMRINVGFKKIVSVRSKTVNYSRLVENYGLIIIVMNIGRSRLLVVKFLFILYTYRRYMCRLCAACACIRM